MNLEDFYSDYGNVPQFLKDQAQDLLKGQEFNTPKGIQRYAHMNIPFEIKKEWVDESLKLNILMAHFKPWKNEMDSLDYPMFLKTIWPNSTVHISYDKSSSYYPRVFDIKSKQVQEIEKLLPHYDVMITRSAALLNMQNRASTKDIISKTPLKFQMRSMGYDHYKHGHDFVFKDSEVGPPPSPVYRSNVKRILKEREKEKIILFVGSFAGWKNQGAFVDFVDPDLCKDYTFLFLGKGIKQQETAEKCKNKKIKYYMGCIDHALMPYFTSISSLNVNNTDSRAWGQPYDPNPRTLGESAVSNTHSICSRLTLHSKELSDYVTSYDHECKKSLNAVLEEGLKRDTSNYNSTFISLEEKCFSVTKIILGKMNKV